jgi:hypothetical protein
MAEAAARAPVPPSLPTEQPPEEVLDRGKVLDGRLTLLASPGAGAGRGHDLLEPRMDGRRRCLRATKSVCDKPLI